MSSSTRSPPSHPRPTKKHSFHGRNGLGAYIASPTIYPTSRVIQHNADFVTIRDLYPKSSIHLLLLPRDPSKSLLHPFTALSDPVFLALIRAQLAILKPLVASELARLFGASSAQERARATALAHNASLAPGASPIPVPAGRDYMQDVRAGIHAGPSMAHLHIHVISQDSHSECMKHQKHYNSFHTPFFVDLEDFPLAEDDPRRFPGREGYLKKELSCWRCGTGFGKAFAELKKHLEKEFEEWKAI